MVIASLESEKKGWDEIEAKFTDMRFFTTLGFFVVLFGLLLRDPIVTSMHQ